MVNYFFFASGNKKRHVLNIWFNNDYLTLGYFFVCLVLWPNLKICHGDVSISGNGRLILTYTRHSWLSSIEDSLACHTYRLTARPLLMVIFRDPWHSHILPSVWQLSCHDLGLSRNTQPSACGANAITDCTLR